MRALAWERAGCLFLVLSLSGPSFSQGLQGAVNTATVTVTAVDGFGNQLANTTVDSFIDEQGHDLVKLFPRDRGTKVPFGKYRVSVQANGSYRETKFDVEISSSDVIITACLEYIGIENTRVTGRFSGKVVGYSLKSHAGWCKASGLYSRMQYESLMSPDLSFDFGEVPSGIYILSCVAEKHVFLLRTVKIAADAKPFAINYRSGDDPDGAQ
jgi:hypothetical protein